MRPENSVLCPLGSFFVPITFHFHEESLPPNHNNHGEPSNSAGYSGLLQLNTSRFRLTSQHNNSFIRPIELNVMIRSYVLGLV
jgi:hypothetical protein